MKKLMLATALGLLIFVKFAGSFVSGQQGALTPTNVRFAQSDIWSAEGLGADGLFGYELGNDSKIEIDGLNSHANVTDFANVLSTGGLSANRLILKGAYGFSDGSWRLTPYVGVGFGTVGVSERLLGNGDYDRVTAYQLRDGVTLGVTQKLLGSLEYRWTNGSKPYLSLAGVPAKLEVNRQGFLIGADYHF